MWTFKSPDSEVERFPVRKSRLFTALAGIFFMFVLIACRGDSTIPQAPTPTPAPASVATPAPTGIIPERTLEFATEDLLKAHRIEPYLIGNLLFIAHWGEDVQRWFVYDVAGAFAPDQLTPPPGVAVPPNPEIEILNELERGKLYDFHVRSDQIVNIVEGEMGDWHFNAGSNFIKWSR